MGIGKILDSTSFGALEGAEQDVVRRLFDDTYQHGEQFSLDHLELFRHRKSLAVSLSYFATRIDEINQANFRYLLTVQKKVIERELLFAFYIFSAQYQLDAVEGRQQCLNGRGEQLKACAKLIEQLRQSSSVGVEISKEAQLATELCESEKHLKYLGLTLVGPLVAKKIMEFTGGSITDFIKTWMSEINGKRLQWVWVNALLSSVISMIPEDFAGAHQASDAISAPSPVTGYMSWILYYTRFAINLCLLLKHTIAGPWMSKEESQIPAWERFKTQWHQRKFSLLNDSIWATANMVCFFWLVGNGMLGYLGNILTALLLVMDTCLCAWGFWEESTEHNKDITRYDHDINVLKDKIKRGSENKQVLDQELRALEREKKQCEVNWRYKKYGLMNDLVYAAGLLAAFSVMCCFLFPPAALAPLAAMILGVAGAALCFLFTTATAAVKGAIDIAKTKESRRLAIDELKETYQLFQQSNDENMKKQLFLDMKQLKCTSDYQARVVSFQKMQVLRSVLIDAMVPSLIFVSFMFMPFGIGLALLAAGFAIALLSNMILKRFEPKADDLPVLEDKEFYQFLLAEKLIQSDNRGLLSTPSFFFNKAISEKPTDTNERQDWFVYREKMGKI